MAKPPFSLFYMEVAREYHTCRTSLSRPRCLTRAQKVVVVVNVGALDCLIQARIRVTWFDCALLQYQ